MPTLSIAIPTYNRRRRLSKTLDVLLPQLTPDVEVTVWDNCSPDDTWDYLGTLPGIQRRRHPVNVGLDRNFLGALANATGDYVWLLCDDDLLCSNAVAEVLAAVRRHDRPAVVYPRARSSDLEVSDYDGSPVKTDWDVRDQDGFLRATGGWFTFGSSMVIRRDRVDLAFAKRYIGTQIVPAAALLWAVGPGDRAAVSREPLVYARGGNAGGYDAYTVFTRNVHRLLTDCRSRGYSRAAVRAAYAANLADVVPYLLRVWPADAKGIVNLLTYGAGHGVFYTKILPAVAEGWVPGARRRAGQLVRWLRGRLRGRSPHRPAAEAAAGRGAS